MIRNGACVETQVRLPGEWRMRVERFNRRGSLSCGDFDFGPPLLLPELRKWFICRQIEPFAVQAGTHRHGQAVL